jgi:hypothetical protein
MSHAACDCVPIGSTLHWPWPAVVVQLYIGVGGGVGGTHVVAQLVFVSGPDPAVPELVFGSELVNRAHEVLHSASVCPERPDESMVHWPVAPSQTYTGAQLVLHSACVCVPDPAVHVLACGMHV